LDKHIASIFKAEQAEQDTSMKTGGTFFHAGILLGLFDPKDGGYVPPKS
jgi:hypothetical protein